MRKPLSPLLCIGVGLTQATLYGQTGSKESTVTEPFHLSKVGYVMLGVADIQAALNFYQGKLGLKATIRTDDLVFFDAGSISLVVSSEVGKAPGDSEVVFAVEHVQPAYEMLSRAGVKFEHEPHPVAESSWAANFRDPDGHILSLFGPR
jgi:catechol 2,3-dioxygenase-like lactoylglutathione lyase family enzyme